MAWEAAYMTYPGKYLGSIAALALGAAALIFAPSAPVEARPHNNTLELTIYTSGNAPEGFRGICGKYPWACSSAAGKRNFSDQELLDLASSVNVAVNREITPMSDLDNYGVIEKWTLPYNGRGDCEDYALLKMKRLIEAGVAPRDLFLATVVDHTDELHVVLVLRTASSGDYILDNRTNRMSPWRSTHYTFIQKQDPSRPSRWAVVLLGPRAVRS
jgi:predicted transglutaminase-like cysteine proteinase